MPLSGGPSSAELNARAGAQEGANKALDMADDGATKQPSRSGANPRVVHPRGRTQPVPLYQRTFARPGRLFAPPVPAARHVMLAMTGGAIIFFIAGGRFDKLLAQVRGQEVNEEPSAPGEVFRTVLGWGVMLSILVFMADTGVMAPLAIGFSWLIFWMILLTYGQTAAQNILGLFGEKPAAQSPEFQLHLPGTTVPV